MPFFQGLICPSSSPLLLNADSVVASSPFTIGFEAAGWKSAGHFVNALILVAFVSAANGVVYVQSRTVYSLALSNRAPKIFAKTTSRGGKKPEHHLATLDELIGSSGLTATCSALCGHFDL